VIVAGWPVVVLEGDAEALHQRDLDPADPAAVWSIGVSRPALVLGSAQPLDDADRALARRRGVEVVRRRSGGGAVLLVPGELWWCDLVVPTGHPAHRRSPGAQFTWAGAAWAGALAASGDTAPVSVTATAARPGPLGRVVCFGALGPGEVVSGAGVAGEPAAEVGAAAKVVGLAQRRTRAGTRVLGLVHRVWRPELTAALVAPGLARIGRDVDEVAAALSVSVVTGVEVGVDAARDVAAALAAVAAGTGEAAAVTDDDR
jgi:lipoate-protein ligase A